MTATEIALALASGGLIGLVLGLVGSGGSILAVPLLIYAVGVRSAHMAIGTAAIAVSLSAFTSLFGHARNHMVKWRCGLVFAATGMCGAAIGAGIGKRFDSASLLAMFGVLMILVGLSMLRPPGDHSDPGVRLSRNTARRLLSLLVPLGFIVGLLAGFFGIGGGFLIVPALMAATRMPMAYAIGTSLFVVLILGLTTSVSYAVSGYVDWFLTALLVVGGGPGAFAGITLGQLLEKRKILLARIFAMLVCCAGLYVAARGAGDLYS